MFSIKQPKDGVLEVDYDRNAEWEKESSKTSILHHTVKAGIYSTSDRTDMYDRYSSYDSHNINWNKVKEVYGQTYHLSSYLKDKGFRWDKSKKAWVK